MRKVREVSIKGAKKRAASDSLKTDIEKEIKCVWIAALEAVEIRFGDDFEGYKNLRARILRVGNDAVRKLKEKVEERYEVSRKPDTIEIRGRGQRNDDETTE